MHNSSKTVANNKNKNITEINGLPIIAKTIK